MRINEVFHLPEIDSLLLHPFDLSLLSGVDLLDTLTGPIPNQIEPKLTHNLLG
jgi:hypothetical protein